MKVSFNRSFLNYLKLWSSAEKKEDKVSQFKLACALFKINNNKAGAYAFELFKKSAKQKYTDATYMLARCCHEGVGTRKSYIRAIKWYKAADDNVTQDIWNNPIKADKAESVALKRYFEDEEYSESINEIFNILYPAKNSTGFTERNLSVNFSKAYEALHPESITWFEFQFGEKNSFHYDAVIINPKDKEILFIESKRFNKPHKRIKDVEEDISRINLMSSEYINEFKNRISDCSSYKLYGVILADVWTEIKSKTKIYESFKNGDFLKNNGINSDGEAEFDIIDFDNVLHFENIKNNYHLISFTWKIALN